MGENTAGGSDSALIFLCHFSGHVKGDEMRQARYWTSRSWLYLCNLVRDGDANQLAGGTPTLVLLGSFDWTSWESQESNYTLTPLPYIIYVLFHLCLKNPYQMSFAQNWEKGIDWSSSSDKSGSGIPATLCWNIRRLDCFSLSMMTALLPQTQTYSNHWSHSSRGVFLTMYLQWEWEWEYPCHYICHQKLATWNSFLIWWECFQPITTFVLFCWTTDKSSCNVLKAHPTILRSLICDFFKIS